MMLYTNYDRSINQNIVWGKTEPTLWLSPGVAFVANYRRPTAMPVCVPTWPSRALMALSSLDCTSHIESDRRGRSADWNSLTSLAA